MRVYQKMIERDEVDGSKTGQSSNRSKSKTGGRPRSVARLENGKSSNEKSLEKSDDEEKDQLREENRRLEEENRRLEDESKTIINKASELKMKDKTSTMQIIELMKLNAYLLSHIPDSDRVIEEFLSKGRDNGINNKVSMSASTSKVKNSYPKGFKSPVIPLNPISNYFKSVDKSEVNSNESNGHKSSHSEGDSDERQTLRKKVSKTKPKRYSSPASDDESDGQKNKNESTSRRVSPRKRKNNTESDTENVRKDQNESTVSRPSVSSNKLNKSETNDKEDNEKQQKKKESTEKPKPKRKRRARVEEPKGLFPCTFDRRQCDEIMDTKEHYDFHMSGHYDAKYVCPFCAYTGPTIQIIKRHLNKERETAQQDAKEGKPLNADKRAHKDIKIYQCLGCKVCNKLHDKLGKRCQHIIEDDDNQCDFMHDMDYEFKDHLKMHFAEAFKNVKDKDERKQKIRKIIDKFVEEQYFENNAKKELLVEKFNKTKEKGANNDTEDKQEKSGNQSSDSDWD